MEEIKDPQIPEQGIPDKPADPPRKIAILGEIAFAGRALAYALATQAITARVLCPDEKMEASLRSIPECSRIEVVLGNLGEKNKIAETMQGVYGATFLSPVNLKGRMYRPHSHLEDVMSVIEAAENSAVRKLVYHSALGAHPTASSQALRQAAEAEELVHGSRCEDFRVRTGPLMGPGDSFLSDILATVNTNSPFMGIPGYGGTNMQPLHVDDMARCLARIFLEQPDQVLVPNVYSLAGPETTTELDLVDMALARLGRSKIKFHAPIFILQLLTLTKVGKSLKERLGLILDLLCTDNSDTLKLLKSSESLISTKQAQEQVLRTVLP